MGKETVEVVHSFCCHLGHIGAKKHFVGDCLPGKPFFIKHSKKYANFKYEQTNKNHYPFQVLLEEILSYIKQDYEFDYKNIFVKVRVRGLLVRGLGFDIIHII